MIFKGEHKRWEEEHEHSQHTVRQPAFPSDCRAQTSVPAIRAASSAAPERDPASPMPPAAAQDIWQACGTEQEIMLL